LLYPSITELKELRTLYWHNGSLFLIDQKALPQKLRYVRCRSYLDVARAIANMTVRGAPAIGVAAAYGLALAAKAAARKIRMK
jgi:methylthioribose-1-phosphate isomerase